MLSLLPPFAPFVSLFSFSCRSFHSDASSLDRPGATYQQRPFTMRTLLDIRPLCLYLCICLSGLQFLSAHDTKDQAIDGAEVKAMGQGNAQAMTFGQEVNYQTYNRTMANSTGQAIGQGSSRGMHDTQPNVKNACDFQAPSNAKDQGQMGSGQAMGKSKDQTLKQSKDSQNSSHSSNDHCSGHNEGGVEVLEVTGAQ